MSAICSYTSFGVTPLPLKYFSGNLPSPLFIEDPKKEKPLLTAFIMDGTPGNCKVDFAAIPTTGKAASIPSPKAVASAPSFNLLVIRLFASSTELTFISLSVFKISGKASKLSDNVTALSGEDKNSAAPPLMLVLPACSTLLATVAFSPIFKGFWAILSTLATFPNPKKEPRKPDNLSAILPPPDSGVSPVYSWNLL